VAVTSSKVVERGLRVFSESSFALAADLGQSNDPTAICVMEHVRSWEVTWKGREKAAGETFDVRYLQRLPLGMSYVEQVHEVARLLGRPPLSLGCELAIDETGVGRPVGDIFNNAGLKPTRITITGGDSQSAKGPRRWHVPKGILISALDARLHTGELRFASELAEAGAMAEELKDFRRNVSAAGRYSYDARVGKHDDLVLAVALALWVFTGKPKYQTPVTGTCSFVGKEK
jgi:hypothetical protein